jgi:hypothetical protein
MARSAALFLFVTLSIAGCAKDQAAGEAATDGASAGDGSDGADGGADGDGTCDADADCEAWEICEDSVCEDGDRNNAVDEAETLLWEDPTTGTINPVGDVDYYRFTAEGGEFVRIESVLADDVIEYGGDTVLTLRDSAGKVVTEANRFATETGVTGVDAAMYAYLSAAGDYTITVQDDGTYGADPEGLEEGFAAYRYELTLSEWSATTEEPDAFAQPLYTIDLSDSRQWATVGVLLHEAGDVDYIGLEVRAGVEGEMLFLDGNQNIDGSDLSPRVRLLDADGDALSDKLGVGPEEYALVPFVEAGSYIIEVSDAVGSGGDDHWTWLHVISRPDDWDGSEFTREVESNDLSATAQELTQTEAETSSGNLYTYSNMLGTVDAPDDEDWYAFSAGFGENWFGLCLNSLAYGSTLSPQVELLDAAGEVVESWSATSAGDPDLYVDNLTLDDGDYFLRVTGLDGAAGALGDWYMFTLYIAGFEATSYGCPDG